MVDPCQSRPLSLSWVTFEEVRTLPPLPSGYTTDRVFRLSCSSQAGTRAWELREVRLPSALVKSYDRGTPEEWLESYLDEGGESGLGFLVAEEAGTVVGLLACRRVEWNRTIWLLDIRVRESWRRRGVGSTLMRELKVYARSAAARGVVVETQTTNAPAIDFYQRHGFAICGFNDHLYSNEDLENQEVALYLFWEADADGGS
jgi:ribosomal protein S18 acetylase RimI-like enzyme